jgi:asparagine synthase (glutamine-hydrolysing)
MVGCCGVVGDTADGYSLDGVARSLVWTGDEEESRYRDGALRLRGFRHPSRRGANPGQVPGADALVWVWGNVSGYRREGDERIEPRDPTVPAPTFCARRYAEDGRRFVERLNGDFVGVVRDRDRGTVSVFTDRVGSRGLYRVETDDGEVVFSSHVQSLDRYPSVDLSFDEAAVVHHLSWHGGPYGVRTPFEGVESYPPGTVTTYALADRSVDRTRYWRPRFPREASRSFDEYVDAFVDRFRAAVEATTRDRSKRYGLLLSGGSDARLVLAALSDLDRTDDLVAYHMGDWMNPEARTAERLAMTAGVEFRFLRRDPAYFERVLDRSPRFWNFQQRFNQAWAEGFIDDIRAEVDALLTGHFLDTMFKGAFVPVRHVDLGPLGTHRTPLELPITSVEEFVDELGPRAPSFVDSDVDLSAVVERNVTRTDDGIEAYGVAFDSLREFALGRLHAPATSDPFFRQSLRESVEHRPPVLDNRLLDLWAATPTRFKTRHNVVNAAVARLDSDLAAVPHADTGVRAGRSRLAHRIGRLPMNALRRLDPFDVQPPGHLDQGPWGNHAKLIRERGFVGDAIEDSAELIRSLPFLDLEAVRDCYRDHLDGATHTRLLYRLVTFLEAPVTRRIAAREADGVDARSVDAVR